MFSYYGSKSKLVNLYPEPFYDKIVEPFAGSARYSLKYWEKDIRLYDNSPVIINVWRYLQEASKSDILGLPDVESKVSLDTIESLTATEKALIGFHLCRGKARPRKTGFGQNSWNRDKIRIANELGKIRHWKIEQLDYRLIDEGEATYFVDPPYQRTQVKTNNDRYPTGDGIDYQALSDWVLSLKGEAIVCEGGDADYLPFNLLKETNANTNAKTVKKFQEMIFHKFS